MVFTLKYHSTFISVKIITKEYKRSISIITMISFHRYSCYFSKIQKWLLKEKCSTKGKTKPFQMVCHSFKRILMNKQILRLEVTMESVGIHFIFSHWFLKVNTNVRHSIYKPLLYRTVSSSVFACISGSNFVTFI